MAIRFIFVRLLFDSMFQFSKNENIPYSNPYMLFRKLNSKRRRMAQFLSQKELMSIIGSWVNISQHEENLIKIKLKCFKILSCNQE